MTGGGSSSRRRKASPGVMESELPTHHRPDPAAVQQQQHEVMDGLDFEYNPLSSYALGSGASHLERISMSGPDGEFDSARGKSSRRRRPGSARKKDGHGGDADQSFRLDFSEGVQKTIEASDELHPRQKHGRWRHTCLTIDSPDHVGWQKKKKADSSPLYQTLCLSCLRSAATHDDPSVGVLGSLQAEATIEDHVAAFDLLPQL